MASVRVASFMTLISRILGLVREIVFGYYFSTGELLSAFRIALQIPNLARRLFGEGALSAAVIPVLTRVIAEEGESEARRMVGSLVVLVGAVLGGASLAVLASAWLLRDVVSDPALQLTSITIPYMPVICITALLGGVLNVRGRFAAPAAAPILFNVVIVATTLGAARFAGISNSELVRVLCYSVLIGGVAQLLLVAIAMRRDGFTPLFPSFRRRINDPEGPKRNDSGAASSERIGFSASSVWSQLWGPKIRSVASLMGPMFLGLSAVQVNTFADSLFAYFFVVVDGARIGPAVLGFAQFLYQFPLGVFGIALATAIFPILSERAAAADHAGLAEMVSRGLRLSAFIAFPSAVGLVLIASPLVRLLYEHGDFGSDSTLRVARSLMFYSVGMVAYFAQHVVIRTFYALHDSKTPARVAMWMVLLNCVCNLALVFPMQESGLALATSVCAVIQVVWLTAILSRRMQALSGSVWGGRSLAANLAAPSLRMIAAVAVMAAAILAVRQWQSVADATSILGQGAYVGALVAIGAGVYAGAARMMKMEELQWLIQRSARRE